MQEALPPSSRSLIIRLAVPDDAQPLTGLIAQLAAHHGDRATTNAERLKADLFAASPWAVALVAERDGGLLGYALLIRLYQAQLAERVMDLHHLFVVPASRNSGIGRDLIRAAMIAAKAEGCAQLVVGTHPDNHRARGFYRKLGFQDSLSVGPKFKLDLGAGISS